MNDDSTAIRARRGGPCERTRIAIARLIAGPLLAGLVTATAAPVLAAPLAAPSVARAGRISGTLLSAAGAPRAFFGLGPASKTKIDGRPFFNWTATPGARLDDHVAIVNFGTRPVTLRVFVTNAVSTARGGTGFAPRGQARGGPAAWVTIHFPHNSPIVHLAPRSKVILSVTLAIPKNAPPGDHVGAIVAALTSVIQSKHHARVHFVQQVADRIVTRVAGKLRPRLSVLRLRVISPGSVSGVATGSAALAFTVQNTGNELLGGKVTVSVSGLLGSTEARTDVVTVPVLLPGGSDSATVQVPGVYAEFLMTGKVSIVPTVVTGQYDPGLTDFSAQTTFWAVPWVPVGLVIALAAAAGLWYWRRRRRRTGAAKTGGVRRPLEKVTEG